MTRISISHIGKCHGNHWEVAGGCELTIAKSSGFFVFFFVLLCSFLRNRNFFHPGYFFLRLTSP